LKLQLIVFGKLKVPGLRDSADHYVTGIERWASFSEIEIRPESIPNKLPETKRAIRERESTRILDRVPPRTPLILLDETGETLPSVEWARKIDGLMRTGAPTISIAIGGSLGFSDEIRTRATAILSLGKQTLSHELARVVALEQLYRSLSILKGHPYHNA